MVRIVWHFIHNDVSYRKDCKLPSSVPVGLTSWSEWAFFTDYLCLITLIRQTKYVKLANIIKKNKKVNSKRPEKSQGAHSHCQWGKNANCFSKFLPFGQISIFWALVFVVNILIFMVVIDSKKKVIGGHLGSILKFSDF